MTIDESGQSAPTALDALVAKLRENIAAHYRTPNAGRLKDVLCYAFSVQDSASGTKAVQHGAIPLKFGTSTQGSLQASVNLQPVRLGQAVLLHEIHAVLLHGDSAARLTHHYHEILEKPRMLGPAAKLHLVLPVK